MTQMGLDYLKLKESQRHNLADEGVRQVANTISQQEADTKAFSASFEPQRVANDTVRAKASEKDADTRRMSHELTSAYAERDMRQKEKVADAKALESRISDRRYSPERLERDLVATEKQAQARMDRNEIEKFFKTLDRLPEQMALWENAKEYGGEGYAVAAEVLNQFNDLNEQLQDSMDQLRSFITRNGVSLPGQKGNKSKDKNAGFNTPKIKQGKR